MGEVVELCPRDRRKVIDEYGELHRRVAGYKPDIDRAAALKKEIESWYADSESAESFEAEGELYRVQIGPKAHQRTIVAITKVFRTLGQKQFLQNCTFPLGRLDTLLPSAVELGIAKEERTGPRKVEVVSLVPLEKAA